MMRKMLENELFSKISAAVEAGRLRQSSAENIRRLLSEAKSDLPLRAVSELVGDEQWSELDDRFYKTLAFGTGGLRGRTIGKIVTTAEQGTPTTLGRPEHPCVGTNTMNFDNVQRATQGLMNYLKKWRAQQKSEGRTKIVIAHDSRHFSKEFADLAAQVAAKNGCDAFVFNGPRSTPELSFTVRFLRACAGVVVTASHNPSHDNGYKVYFDDGAQVIEPHASGIIAEVDAIERSDFPVGNDGQVNVLGEEIERAYMARLETLVLNRELLGPGNDLKIVYTPIHGTGAVMIKPLLSSLGLNFSVVAAQDTFDGRFPTVKSPNPENAEALQLAVAQAQTEKADVVIATDPDCDRMGVAVRGRDDIKLLTGNQTGALLAWYRTQTLFAQGILSPANARRARLIKTFVTTELQKAIARKFGIPCVETLTGFKYIGAKMEKYEKALPPEIVRSYRDLSEAETRAARLESSAFYVFGSEESYGYSGADFVRDKDANAATVMFCEMAAFAKKRNLTILELLDSLYQDVGYFDEKGESLVFEGADGANKIRRLLLSYEKNPPAEIDGIAVSGRQDFAKDEIRDVEGDLLPKEKMLIFTLADQTRIAVRGSGTEPKIKFYLFGQRPPTKTSDELEATRKEVGEALTGIWDWLQRDAEARIKTSTA